MSWKRKLILLVVITGLQLFLATVTTAQPPLGDQVAVEFRDNQITLYTINAAGEKQIIQAATNTLRSALYPQTNFSLLSRNKIRISPDGAIIAFVGVPVDDFDASLFLYFIATDTLEQIKLPTAADIYWSPNSQYLVLGPAQNSFDRPILTDLYLYDLSAQTLTPLTNTPENEVETAIMWLPDSETILFAGSSEKCQQACTDYVRNLYSITRNGGIPNKLTDLGTQLPTIDGNLYQSCDIETVAWSNLNNRIRYIVLCDENYHLLFSTTLKGDNRLDINLPALFPGELQLWVHDVFDDIPGNNLILITSGLKIDSSSGDNHTYVRILIWSPAVGNTSIIYSDELIDTYHLSSSDLSDDGNSLVIGLADLSLNTDGSLWVVDLDSGKRISEHNVDSSVCSVSWRQNKLVVFDQIALSFCSDIVDSLWLWDTQTDTIESLDIKGVVFVYPTETTIKTEPAQP
ncbi:MAG TPA: hypothetical protein VHO69_08500 [Phototrophicaceae bacterium]|nr:hypothetical protein [Phototrophicaceae bacterium]